MPNYTKKHPNKVNTGESTSTRIRPVRPSMEIYVPKAARASEDSAKLESPHRSAKCHRETPDVAEPRTSRRRRRLRDRRVVEAAEVRVMHSTGDDEAGPPPPQTIAERRESVQLDKRRARRERHRQGHRSSAPATTTSATSAKHSTEKPRADSIPPTIVEESTSDDEVARPRNVATASSSETDSACSATYRPTDYDGEDEKSLVVDFAVNTADERLPKICRIAGDCEYACNATDDYSASVCRDPLRPSDLYDSISTIDENDSPFRNSVARENSQIVAVRNVSRSSVAQENACVGIGQETTPASIGQETTPASIGQESTPASIGQETTPASIGQETTPASIGQETTPASIGQNDSLSSIGQEHSSIGQENSQTSIGQENFQASIDQNDSQSSIGQENSHSSIVQNDSLSIIGQENSQASIGQNDSQSSIGQENSHSSIVQENSQASIVQNDSLSIIGQENSQASIGQNDSLSIIGQENSQETIDQNDFMPNMKKEDTESCKRDRGDYILPNGGMTNKDKVKSNENLNSSEKQLIEDSNKAEKKVKVSKKLKKKKLKERSCNKKDNAIISGKGKHDASKGADGNSDQSDDWDANFDSDGDEVNPQSLSKEAMSELTFAVGKVSIRRPSLDYLSYKPQGALIDPGAYNNQSSIPANTEHLVELYDFSAELTNSDLERLLPSGGEFSIKWVDDTHAIGVFRGKTEAKGLLEVYAARPATSAFVAHSMISGALGIRNTSKDRERLKKEKNKVDEAKGQYSRAAANFTSCAVQFARPIKICERCFASYDNAIDIYSTMMKGDVVNIEGIACGIKILNADRIQIVVSTAKFIENMWQKSNCRNCFKTFANGTRSDKLNEDCVNFKSLAHETFECFQNYTTGDLHVFVPTHIFPNSTVCRDCQQLYSQLNSAYAHLEAVYAKQICMDLVDSMNYTRILWSSNLNCKRKPRGEGLVIAVSFLLGSVPVLFYVLHRLLSRGRRMTLLKQKRMVDPTSDRIDQNVFPPNEENQSRLSSQSL